MFSGESFHTLDEKNRLVIPRTVLESLEGEEDRNTFYLTRGPASGDWGCLYLLPASRFEDFSRTVPNLFGAGDTLDFQRLLGAGSQKVSLDGQNRILIPDRLRGFARIEREVAVVGAISRVEIWAAPLWREYSADLDSRFNHLASLVVANPPKDSGPSGASPRA